MKGIEVGGFILERLIGRGGMADVWSGRHRIDGQRAAIKVITQSLAQDPRYLKGFKREVRAVAALDHPGVVTVFDAGIITAETASRSGGRLIEGSPWLAMMLAEHGVLRRLPTPMPWATLREALLQILDALAHAHARDVIHRDLKPENVLLHVEDEHMRLMLTDFGIAHFVEAAAPEVDAVDGQSAGTPNYMAPEQFRGHWRDFGPWTDLYALGCMAYELATGSPPYAGPSPMAIANGHLGEGVPRLVSGLPMPPGFETWVARMMSPTIGGRFPSAADAAFALGRLADPDPEEQHSARTATLSELEAVSGRDDTPTLADSDRVVALAETHVFGPSPTLATMIDSDFHRDFERERAEDVESGIGMRADSPARPPLPSTWFLDVPRRPLLRGAGLGLFGVRTMPFVGREAERTGLWNALADVGAVRKPRLMVLSGPEGSGKSALATWFGRRVREVAGAEVIPVWVNAMETGSDALSSALDGWFQSRGLSGDGLVDRIRNLLIRRDPDPRMAELVAGPLARFVRPDMPGPAAVMMSPTERHSVVYRWLMAISIDRPVVLLLDDLQWSVDIMAFLEWVLDHAEPLPVLMVATVQIGAPDDGSPEAMALARLMGHDRSSRLSIGPLTGDEHDEAVEELLGLSHRLSDALRFQSVGNPLLAMQLMTDLIEDGALVPTEHGYDCTPGTLEKLPVDLRSVALRRIYRLAQRSVETQSVLTLLCIGAALGHAVDAGEWARVARRMKVSIPPDLVDALYDAGLAVPGRTGWVFRHRHVRSALINAVGVLERWSVINRACAEELAPGTARDERRARHLVVARDEIAAIDVLIDAARQRMSANEYTRVLRLCDWRIELMDRCGLPDDDIRRARALPIRADALRFTGDWDGTRATLQRLSGFDLADAADLRAELARLRGGMAFVTGRIEVFFSSYSKAIELYRQTGDARGETQALHGQGWSLIFLGRLKAAERVFAEARAVAARAGLRVDEGWALHGWGAARLYGEGRGAKRWLDEAAAAFIETRQPSGTASVRVCRAEQARQEKRFEDTLDELHGAAEIWASVGSRMSLMVEVELAGLELDRGQDASAFARLAELTRGGIERVPMHYYRRTVLIFQALAALRLGRQDEAIDLFARIIADPQRTFAAPGARHGLVEIGERFEAIGRGDLAASAWRAAAEVWQHIDPPLAATLLERAG